jgi:indolepyruvate ferredoxin oxidoreductase beta subunit
MDADQPVRLLIAAMGGEGGGVLAGWITQAAAASDLWVQRTSVPGVAQRTGATTYYLEFLPRKGDERPVLALNPAPGRVDVVLASELLEATRMIQAGFVTPDRTHLIASTHRIFTVDEKSAMADGRLPADDLAAICRRFSREALLGDFADAAAANQCHLNAVLLGTLAATKTLPIPDEAFRRAVSSGGKAVEANLRGFEAGLGKAKAPPPAVPAIASNALAAAVDTDGPLVAEARSLVPQDAGDLAAEGVRRLLDFQGEAYARLYLDRLKRFVGLDGADGGLLGELARHLAVRMSFEDTIRVAQLKLRATRLADVEAEARARAGDIVDVTEFMKPGPEEILSILPPRLARAALGFVDRRGWTQFSMPMRITTTRPSGFLRLRLLAALRRWRPRTLRFAEEQAWIERWLTLVAKALAVDPGAAREIVETAKLVRGYGATYKRGMRNWTVIVERIVEPTLDGRLPEALFADAVVQARVAALADPQGDKLDQTVRSFENAAAERRLAAAQ